MFSTKYDELLIGSSGKQRSSKTRQTSGSPGTGMPPPTAQSVPSSSGGPPSSFWEKFSSMFGTSGQAPPPQSGTQSGSQAGNGQAVTDSQPSMMSQPSAPAQAPPPSWAYSPQASGSTDQAGCAPSAQSNQRKRGLGQYGPVHGGVSLSNIPYTETSMPFQSASENVPMSSQMGDTSSNIPSMSFSINPTPPLASLPQPSLDPARRLPMAGQPEAEPSYILARPSLPTSVQVSYPARVDIPAADQPYVYIDSGSPALVPAKNDRVYYVIDPLDSSRGYVQVSEPVQPAANLYRMSRSEKPDDLEKDLDPVLLYSISKNGKTGKEIKKILLDPDNGLVISKSDDQTSIRRKRSAAGDEEEKPDDAGEEVKDDDKTEAGDPNGHSHHGNDQVENLVVLKLHFNWRKYLHFQLNLSMIPR